MHREEPSLLTHLEKVRTSTIPEGGLSTVIYCGKVRSDNESATALQVHREIVESEVNKESVIITGILMGQANSVMHLLEGPSSSILRILEGLASHKHFVEQDVQIGTIVYNVEDRPERFFPEWYSFTIQERKTASEVNEETCKEIVFEMANRLLEVGNGLRSDSSGQLDLSRYADHLPGKSLIVSLAQSDCFFSLQDYVEFYCDPYHIELESEQAWPLERLVQY